MAERYHRYIVRQVGRGYGSVLVPASHGNQHIMGYEPLDEPSCRLDISSRWYGDNHRVWLVSLHRYEPVSQRKIWSKIENRHPSPPGRRGVREDAELDDGSRAGSPVSRNGKRSLSIAAASNAALNRRCTAAATMCSPATVTSPLAHATPSRCSSGSNQASTACSRS